MEVFLLAFAVVMLSMQCSTGSWSNSVQMCEKVCSPLVMPSNSVTCQKTVMANPVTSADMAYFAILPKVPASEAPNFWNATSGGCRPPCRRGGGREGGEGESVRGLCGQETHPSTSP